MRLLILSDLHREIRREFAPRIDLSISHPDVVVLAGDIDLGARAISWAMSASWAQHYGQTLSSLATTRGKLQCGVQCRSAAILPVST
jgi:hypothetical protein